MDAGSAYWRDHARPAPCSSRGCVDAAATEPQRGQARRRRIRLCCSCAQAIIEVLGVVSLVPVDCVLREVSGAVAARGNTRASMRRQARRQSLAPVLVAMVPSEEGGTGMCPPTRHCRGSRRSRGRRRARGPRGACIAARWGLDSLPSRTFADQDTETVLRHHRSALGSARRAATPLPSTTPTSFAGSTAIPTTATCWPTCMMGVLPI